MATPKKRAILEKAIQLFIQDQYRNGTNINTTPSENELKENGYFSQAQSELMCSDMASFYGIVETKKAKSEKRQQKHVDLNFLCDEILKFGDLLMIANKGNGKTNALMEIAKELRKDTLNKVVIFETFPKWIHEFDSIPYLYIRDSDVIKNDKSFRSLRAYEVKKALSENKDLLFCLGIEDTDRLSFFIASIINYFYRKNYLTAYKYGLEAIRQRVIFVCEESQNLFDSTILNKRLFNRLRKMFTESRNLKLHFVMASQRIQDLNTKIRGRTRYLIGCVNIDDYDLKVNRMLRNSEYRREVLEFEIGKFVYPSKDSLIRFEKFQQHDKPYECVYGLEKVLAK